jgi:hypothetical protein
LRVDVTSYQQEQARCSIDTLRHAAQTRDARFAFGLDCLLDGMAARVMR